jgi:hypothetical protein
VRNRARDLSLEAEIAGTVLEDRPAEAQLPGRTR